MLVIGEWIVGWLVSEGRIVDSVVDSSSPFELMVTIMTISALLSVCCACLLVLHDLYC